MKMLKKLLAVCLLSQTFAWAVSAQVNITTWQVDPQHTGNNANETILTPGNVHSPQNFGLLFSQTMDGQSYGQPLVMSGVNVSGSTHNLVFAATEHCSIYAFDADNNTGANANPIWHVSLLPAGTVPFPQSVSGSGDIDIEVGLTTTPVIDPATNTIYVVSKVQRTSDTTYHQYLYALDIATGTTKFNSPVEINPTFSGTSIPDASGGVIPFNAQREHMRAAMALSNGIVYLTYASHSDTGPYHGEVIGYDKTTLQVVKTFIATPNGNSPEGGIWQSGANPAFDSAGNMFLSVANGNWDNNGNWGQSMVKIVTSGTNIPMGISVANTLNWFTPNNWDILNSGGNGAQGDLDLGAGGILLLPDQSGPHTHLLVSGGKGGVIYVVDRDNMGGIHTPDNVVQEIPELNSRQIFSTPAYFNGFIYHSASGGPLEQRQVSYDPVAGTYIATTPIISPEVFNNKGSSCFISSSGTTNGIVWMLDSGGILRAYDAANVSTGAIYSANATLPNNINCQTMKFGLPTVANGKVYFAAYDNNHIGHFLVYGLLPTPPGSPGAPSNAVATPTSSSSIQVTWTANSSSDQFKVKRSTQPNNGFVQVGNTTNPGVTSFIDTGLSPFTTYYYQVVATNSFGDSNASNVATTATFPSYTENGLVAYLPMDEAGGATLSDVAGNNHTGTINGEAGIALGLINNGVGLHGTGSSPSNIIIANKADMQFTATQSFTLSIWVRADALRSSDEAVVAKSRDQGNYYGIWINSSNQWVFRGPGGDLVGPAVSQGTWTHVTAVQDGTANTRKLYINGTLAATGTAQAADGAGDFWIGQQNILNTFASFPGVVDELRLYKRALAATEVTTLMGPPVLAATSNQVHGGSGTRGFIIWPVVGKEIESRKGSTPGSYSIALNFSAPVSGITASLGLQGGGSAVGSVNSVSYDSTGKVVTVNLVGVGNVQGLNLHLSGIPAGTASTAGTADIPFNVLWGDVNSDNVVNALDLSIVQHSQASVVSNTTAFYDINCNGAIDATDASLVNAAIGTNLGAQLDTNLAFYQPTVASSGSSSGALAVDADLVNSRWESDHGIDPQYFYVDLGSVCTIHAVNLIWENAAGKDYTIDACTGDPSVEANWSNLVPPITGNLTGGPRSYPGLNASGRYVRMRGTARASQYGYSLYDFEVIGLSGTGSSTAPVITGGLSVSGTVGATLSYPITATNNPTSYTASGLPGGLSINTSTGVISGMPTASGTTSVPISAINSSGTGTATLTISVGAGGGGAAPVITSGTTATGTVGSALNYQITASNTPTSFNATGLPGGLGINTATGVISGTPSTSGTTTATISAINTSGTGSSPLVFSISGTGGGGGGSAPVITSGSAANGVIGSAFNYQITASNNPTSYGASGLPAGLSVNTSTGAISGTPTAAGNTTATISAINTSGTGTASLAISVSATADVNLALAKSGTASSVFNGNTAAFAFDGDVNTRWESVQGTGADPSYIYVDLGQVDTIHSVVINWENAAGADYTIDVATGDPTVETNWSHFVAPITGNTTAGVHTYTGNATARYVRMNGTARTTPWGYSILEFQVMGVVGTGGSTPVITSGSTASATVGSSFSYVIQASNNPTSFGASNLPAGLSVNTANGLISGTATMSGTTTATISAINTSGTGTSPLVFAVSSGTGGGGTDINLALSGSAKASTEFNNNTANLAIDNNVNTRWESVQGTAADPSYIYVDLGQVDTIHSVVINWENAAGADYTIDVATGDPTVEANWSHFVAPITGNTTAGVHTYTGNATARYVRMNGTARTTPWGYSILEFQVMGVVGTGGGSTVPVITSGTAVNGTVGSAVSYQIQASNSPTSFSAGNLPAGLSVNTTTGLISGTATTTGTTSAVVSAINTSGTGSATVVFSIANTGAAPVITSGSTASTTVGSLFSYQIQASNNPASFSAANLPAGLTVNTANGLISGTATTTGTTTSTISAINTSGTGSAPLVISVAGNSDINLALAKSGTASSVFNGNSASLAFDNDVNTRWESVQGPTADPSYIYVDLGQVDTIHSVVINWENAAGADYTIDVATGDPTVEANWSHFVAPVVGNTTPGVHTYTGNATARYVRMNGTARTGPYGYSILEFQVWGVVGTTGGTVPVITSGTTMSGTAGSFVSYQIQASNTPTSFGASNLPAGLSVNTNNGLISGTATTSGTISTVVNAINTSGTGSATVVFFIGSTGAAPVITSGTTATGTLASAFSYQIQASNNPTSFTATNLPAGLSVNTANGLISGTATTTGTTTATINAINLSGTGTAPLVIAISTNADTNLAQGLTPTASSYQDGNFVANSTDGNTGTRWAASDGSYPQWWKVDLGANKTLSHVDVNWFNSAARAYQYKIEVSTDDSNYSPVADKTSNTTFGDTSDSITATARYVRITITGATAGFASAYEIKVFGH